MTPLDTPSESVEEVSKAGEEKAPPEEEISQVVKVGGVEADEISIELESFSEEDLKQETKAAECNTERESDGKVEEKVKERVEERVEEERVMGCEEEGR